MSDINDDPATTTPASLPATDSTAQPTSNNHGDGDISQVQTSQHVTNDRQTFDAINTNTPTAKDTTNCQDLHHLQNSWHPMRQLEAEPSIQQNTAALTRYPPRPPRQRRVYNPEKHCGAKSRSAGMQPCTNPKGFGTDHFGSGVCRNHGGVSKLPAGGRYSTVMRPALKASIEKHDADPRPMDLIPEVSLLRALVEEYVVRYDVIRDALLAWHMAIQQGSSTPIIPARLPDITEAGRLIERVARVADTIHRIQTEGSISLACFWRLTEVMGMDVARLVGKTSLADGEKSALLEEIQSEWGKIKVDTNRRPT